MDYREWCVKCDKYEDEEAIVICRNAYAFYRDDIVGDKRKCFHHYRIIMDKERREAFKKCKHCKHMKIERFNKSIYYKWINELKGKKDNENYVYKMICENEKSNNFNNTVDICDTCDKFKSRNDDEGAVKHGGIE